MMFSGKEIKNIKGLSAREVSERLCQYGYNEIPSQKRRNVFLIFFHVIKEPMLLLLIGSGTIYFFLGEQKDALMLLSFVMVVVGITFYQERKTERTLEALRDLSSPRALVIRDGEQKRIAGREIVKDDIIMIREGDRVPADAVVLSCSNLLVDESLLTGESVPVCKSDWDGKGISRRPGGEDLPFVYSGTLVVSGRGILKVTSIGVHTEMGKIGKALQGIHEEDTLLKKETGKIVRNFSIAGTILCLLVIIIYGLTRGNWLNGILSGLTLSMAMLPEEFPVVLIIFLTLGAWRISKSKVLTRRAPAIETLGAATVLCTDKTGTLTLNSMYLTTLCVDGVYYDVDTKKIDLLPEIVHDLVEYGILASQKDPFDPVEKEVKRLGEFYLSGSEHIHNNWRIIKEYPLSKQLLALSHVWESPDKCNYVISAKGSPEAIADLCHFNQLQQNEMKACIEDMSRRGLRVLGVARSSFKKMDLPDVQHDFVFEFVGLLGFIDPVRETVTDSIREAYEAGIRVIMITGDYPGTAIYIAKQIGLKNSEQCITGPELEKMDALQLRDRIKTINVFARVVPEQKLLIVNALKANGEIVAMTGDGVNDAPALKAANIGIAMGDRGTDVAREASALVLLNDDFSSIVQAVKLGRRIFDNLKKAIAYIFAIHVPIAGMSFLPVLFHLPIVLLPAHIAFLELIIDPACSIVFEACPDEKNIMNRPPRNLHEALFNRKTFIFSLLQGLSILVVVFSVFLFALYLKKGEFEARTLAFVTLVFANVMLIMMNLSWSKNLMGIVKSRNQALGWVVFGALLALGLVIYVPILRNLFHFSELSLADIIFALASGMVSLAWFEGLKAINKKFFPVSVFK
ncbi:cation transport ATPase [Candidatus Omnitrophus magneticus]|uniref:Cation transport ATPase n=1 Tax=Candidatus Omnitrophus magneticus TaxID=1609969 RepID=A0A0F0CP75_9BACT|nr:cation transport ATPase [Candidatus Omnitrophus magneticus]